MSDKESADEKAILSEDVENEESKAKGQKRKRPEKKVTASSKKKLKTEEPPVPKSQTETESEQEEVPMGLLDRSPEVTGTRIRKQVERLNINSPAGLESPDRRKHELLPGKGAKLGTSPKIVAQLQNVKQSDMVLLHRLLFKRPGTAHEIKKNIREFSGFPFTKDDKEFESRKHMLEKNTLTDLKFICQILCLEKSGTKEAIIERILDFCLCPDPSTKPVAKKAKKSKEKKKSKAKSDDEKKGSEKKKAKKTTSPKKNPLSSPTVEDSSSSSSEDDEEASEHEESSSSPSPQKKVEKVTSPKTPKEATKKKSKESTAAKTKKDTPAAKPKKKTPKKSPKKVEIKVKLPLINKAKKKLAPVENDDSEAEEENKKVNTSANAETDEEKSKEKSPSPKKASANNKEKSPKEKDSPSPKKSKNSEPTNEELTAMIKQILKGANLEDMTMKNLCRQVYDKYPDCDLEKNKKEFIRSTAREILGGGD